MAIAKSWFSMDKKSARVHSAAQFRAKYNHNYRVDNPINADKERTQFNEELIHCDADSFNKKYHEKIRGMEYYQERKVRKDAVRGVEFTLQIGTGDLPADFDLEKWKSKCVEWLNETFGDNVISAVLHMDETNPHIHCMVIPEIDGRLNAKEMFNRPHLKEYQASFAEKVARECGLGERQERSRAHHEDIALFYKAINDAKVERLPIPQKNETLDDYFVRANEAFQYKAMQALGVQKEMERKIVDIKNSYANKDLEYYKMGAEIEELHDILGENIEETKRKIKLVERINYALSNHPDQNLAQDSMAKIAELVNWAKEQEQTQNLEKTTEQKI